MSDAGAERPGTARAAAHRPSFCAEGARPWILAAAIVASAMGFIDGSVVAIALPAMRDGLGASLAQATWISNGYLLPLSALILVGGALGDRYGVARVFGIGIAIFVAASVLTALAPGPATLIAARAVKGVGAALMVPGSLAIIAKAYPREERGRAIGWWAAASAVTTAIGPVLGGAMLSLVGDWAWRLVFLANLPLGLGVLWILARRIGEDAPSDEGAIDWPGGLLATAALGLGAWALTALGGAGPSPALLGIGALAAMAAFLWREARAAHPMMPLGLFRSRVFAGANLATLLLYFALSAVLFYLPQTVIAGWGRSELEMSLIFVPFSALMAVLGPVAGRLADRIGPGRPIGAGSALVAASFAGLALTAPLQSFYGAVLPLVSLMGLGMALVVSPLSAAVMGAVEDARSGTASGINNAVSRMAGLIAVAAMGALAAASYRAAGGAGEFGGPGAEADAMNAALSAVCWFTAAMAAAASAVGFGLARRG